MVLRCRYAREYGQLATARKGELGLLLRHTRLFRARAASGQTARTGPHLHRLRHGHGGFRAAGYRTSTVIMEGLWVQRGCPARIGLSSWLA